MDREALIRKNEKAKRSTSNLESKGVDAMLMGESLLIDQGDIQKYSLKDSLVIEKK